MSGVLKKHLANYWPPSPGGPDRPTLPTTQALVELASGYSGVYCGLRQSSGSYGGLMKMQRRATAYLRCMPHL
jgi:hypothetical protein